MLSLSELREIREHLERAQNPLFFFDNDVDGLCSFLLLQRAVGRGKGVAIKSYPDLDANYSRKIEELNPDYVFILDKPRASNSFIEFVLNKNIPIVWIDHHNVQVEKEILEKVYYYNSFPSSEPVTYICYNIFERKEDRWIAMIGCIGDVFMPDFAKEFAKDYPELFNANIPAFDCLYMTEIGKLVMMLNFALKDTTTNVLNMMKFVGKAKGPYDLLEENSNTRQMHKKYAVLIGIYNKIVKKAENSKNNSNLIFLEYSGNISMSSEIANGVYFHNKDKFVVIGYKKEGRVNFSIRGKNAREITQKAIHGIEGATGGGHEVACGARIPSDKFEEFKKRIEELVV